MKMYYSASTNGFYTTEIHGYRMPADIVEITSEQHSALLAGQAAGKVIAADESGCPVLKDRPAPTNDQAIDLFRSSIQAHLDSAAVAAGYDDIRTAVTYAEEPAVPKFQAEGRAFRAWRSLVWDYAYAQLDAAMAGERERPTIEEFLGELPELQLQE